MSLRREAREVAVQTLYAIFSDVDLEQEEELDLDKIVREKFEQTLEIDAHQLKQSQIDFTIDLVINTLKKLDEIDPMIKKYSKNWDFHRIALIDKCVLRLGIMEMKYKETPVRVVLNEAIEIAKSFSGKKAGKFVNGILDAIMHAGK